MLSNVWGAVVRARLSMGLERVSIRAPMNFRRRGFLLQPMRPRHERDTRSPAQHTEPRPKPHPKPSLVVHVEVLEGSVGQRDQPQPVGRGLDSEARLGGDS